MAPTPDNLEQQNQSPESLGQATLNRMIAFSKRIENLENEGKLADKSKHAFTMTGDGTMELWYARIDEQPNEKLALTMDELEEMLQYVQQWINNETLPEEYRKYVEIGSKGLNILKGQQAQPVRESIQNEANRLQETTKTTAEFTPQVAQVRQNVENQTRANEITTYSEFLQEINKVYPKPLSTKDRGDGYFILNWEPDDVYANSSKEIIISKENYISFMAEWKTNKPAFDTIDGFIIALEELENDFKFKKQLVKKNFGEHLLDPLKKDDTKQRMQKETTKKIDDRINYIHNFKKEKQEERRKMERRNRKSVLTPTDPTITQVDVDNFTRAFHQRDLLEADIKNFQAGILDPQAEFPVTSKEYMKHSAKENRKHYEMKKELNLIKKDVALLKIFEANEKKAEEYFDAIILGHITPNLADYTQQVALYLAQHAVTYPCLYKHFKNNIPAALIWTPGLPSSTRSANSARGAHNTHHTINRPSSYENLDRKEAYQQGGVGGVVRKSMDFFPNLDNKTKDTRSSLLTTAGLVYAGWKGIQWLFSTKDENGKRKRSFFPGWWKIWALIGLGVVVPKITTGKNAAELFAGLFNGTLNFDELKGGFDRFLTFGNKEALDTCLAISPFGEYTARRLQENIPTWENNPAVWSNFYTTTDATLRRDGNTAIAEEFSKYKDDPKKLKEWLNRIGIGYPCKDESLLDKPLKDIIDGKTNPNKEKLNAYLKEKWLQPREDKQAKIAEYLLNRNFSDDTIRTMEQEGLFELDTTATHSNRDADKQAREQLHTQVYALSSLTFNDQEKANIYRGIEEFYNERAIAAKPCLEICSEGDKIYFKSHKDHTWLQQSIEIDLKNKTLPHFQKDSQNLVFHDYTQLFRTAYATNGLMNIVKDKETTRQDPFVYRSVGTVFTRGTQRPIWGSGIYFDTAKREERDRQLLSNGLFWTAYRGKMDNIANTLYKNPEEYANYLNHLRKEKGGKKSEASTETFETLPNNWAKTKEQITQLWLAPNEACSLQKACNEIYATYGEEAQKMGIKLEKQNDTLLFTTYNKTLKLNLTSKTLENLKNDTNHDIVFKDAGELIKAANLTNAIAYHCKDRIAKSNIDPTTRNPIEKYHPFYIDIHGNLVFRGTGENTVIATGMHRTLERLPNLDNAIRENSPTLNDHKQDFAKYLNAFTPSFRLEYAR